MKDKHGNSFPTCEADIRAVIPEKNILIDNSFETLLNEERENFIFHGGVEHE